MGKKKNEQGAASAIMDGPDAVGPHEGACSNDCRNARIFCVREDTLVGSTIYPHLQHFASSTITPMLGEDLPKRREDLHKPREKG